MSITKVLCSRAVPTPCANKTSALLKLALELWRRRVSIRLVLGIYFGTETLGLALVEQHRYVLRCDLLHEVADEATKTVQRIDRIAIVINHVIRH